MGVLWYLGVVDWQSVRPNDSTAASSSLLRTQRPRIGFGDFRFPFDAQLDAQTDIQAIRGDTASSAKAGVEVATSVQVANATNVTKTNCNFIVS